MRDINLLPSIVDGKKKSLRDGRVYVLIAVVVLIPVMVFGYLFLFLNPEIEMIGENTKQLNANILKYSKVNIVKDEKVQLEAHTLALTNILERVDKQQNVHTDILDSVTKLMPENVFAVNYAISNKSITMNCRALTEESIAYFLRSVKESNLYSNVTFSGITKNKTTEGIAQDYSFSLLLELAQQ